MQPTIHCNKKPDIEAANVRVFLLMNCGLHFLFIIPRESPCSDNKNKKNVTLTHVFLLKIKRIIIQLLNIKKYVSTKTIN
jgi:hypothetical protein